MATKTTGRRCGARVLASGVVSVAFALGACGTEEELPQNGVDVGGTDAASSDADAGGACAVLDLLPDRAEVALTPRADRIVEAVALECSDGAFPDAEWTEMVAADLALIRVAVPDVADIEPHTYMAREGGIYLSAESNAAAVELAEHPTVRCVAELLDGFVETPGDRESSTSTGVYMSAKAFNADAFGAVWDSVPEIDAWSGNLRTGDGDDVQVRVEGSAREYWFERGLGDCPSGCTAFHWFWVRVDNGAATLLGEWAESFGAMDELEGVSREEPAGFPAADTWGCERAAGAVTRRWE